MKYYNDADDAYFSIITRLSSANQVKDTQEILNDTHCLLDPTKCIVNVEARNFHVDYALAEVAWYIKANPDVSEIGKMATIWDNIKDKHGNVESNYGEYIFDIPLSSGDSQWKYVKDELLKDPESRRAVLNINNTYHKTANPKDVPCTETITFYIRDNALNMTVKMRSNDAVFGWCNDIFAFSFLHQLMRNELIKAGFEDLKLGEYYHNATSLHIYKRHWKFFERDNSKLIEEPLKLKLTKDLTYDVVFDGVKDKTLKEGANWLKERTICKK